MIIPFNNPINIYRDEKSSQPLRTKELTLLSFDILTACPCILALTTNYIKNLLL